MYTRKFFAIFMAIVICLSTNSTVFASEKSNDDEKYSYTYSFDIVDGVIQSKESSDDNTLVINSPNTSGTLKATASTSSRIVYTFMIPAGGKTGQGSIHFQKASDGRNVLYGNSTSLPADGKSHSGTFEGQGNHITKGSWTVTIKCNVPFLCVTMAVGN